MKLKWTDVTLSSLVLLSLAFPAYMTTSERDSYCGVTNLEDGASYASIRRGEAHGVEWLSQDEKGIHLNKSPVAPVVNSNNQLIILVHGFNAAPDEVGPYFSDVVSYISASTHGAHSFLVFDWPADKWLVTRISTAERRSRKRNRIVCLEDLLAIYETAQQDDPSDLVVNGIISYPLARDVASRSASAFADLINLLAKQGSTKRITIIAHSRLPCPRILKAASGDCGCNPRYDSASTGRYS
jgi:hypothetical protein